METQNDHDLLIRVDTKLGTLIGEMQLLRDDSRARLDRVEQGKLEKSDFLEYKVQNEKSIIEVRTDLTGSLLERFNGVEEKVKGNSANITVLNRNMYILIGIGLVLQFAIPIIIKLLFK